MPPRDGHVFSENAGRLIIATALAGLTGTDADARTRWIHVAPFGQWKGHPNGPFALTREVFDSIVSDIASRKTPVALDYEHASVNPTGGPVLCSGYVQRAEVRSDGLWALVELTETAAKHVGAGEIRFCSGAFKFDAVDGETGIKRLCVLHSIGLTSWPFIDGQQPITLTRFFAASATTGDTSMNEVDMKALQKLLDAIPGPNTPDKVKKAIDLMGSGAKPDDSSAPTATSAAKPVVPAAKPITATDPAPMPAPTTASDPMPPVTTADPAAAPAADPAADPDDDIDARIMAALGISDPSAYADLLNQKFDALVALLSGSASPDATSLSRDAAVTALTATIKDLKTKVEASEKRERENAVSGAIAEVDAAIAAGMVQATQRDELVTLSKQSPSEARRTVSLIVASHKGTMTLTQTLAPTIARNEAKPSAEGSPAFVALTNTLRQAGLKPEDVAWKNAIKTLTA